MARSGFSLNLVTTYIICVMNTMISFDKWLKFTKFTNNTGFRDQDESKSVYSAVPSLEGGLRVLLCWAGGFNLIIVFSNQ